MNRLIRKFTRAINAARGKDFIPKIDYHCPKEKFGSAYGGWEVALGPVRPSSIVYSFGVGEDASFDIALIERYGLTIHAFDPTPKSIEWVKQQKFPAAFVMHDYGLAEFDGVATFNPPENPAHVSYTILTRPETAARAIKAPMKRLSAIMKLLGHDRIDILKMDIEGAEYGVIRDIEKSNIRPGQLFVEFHHRFPGVGILKTREAVTSLRNMGYLLFSISDTEDEYSFILKNRVLESK